ncbi:serine hydrolase domain-containing protein [Nicoliella lavandulae]|uniref:Serine hydrolase domain-containing protein n=1 Tax=Nicoliella lavandulae TaxID=3082954 RepID=A0ABU8SLL3_9LACO
MNFERSKMLIRQMVTDQVVPGASDAFFDGANWQVEQLGQRQVVPSQLPLTAGLTYDVASLTKVVATLPVILQLIEQGQLGLQDSVSEYLPEFDGPAVKIFNLLTHTSGIEGYIPNRNQLDKPTLVNALLTQLHVGPNLNRKMVYADVNFIYLGWIASRILGQPIQDLAIERVFKPLNMTGATFTPDPVNCVPTEMTAHGLLQGQVDDPKAQILGRDCGSAGLFATMADLIKFSNEMMQPTGKILSTNTIHALMADHTINGHLGRSYGWAFDHCQHDFIWQTGYTGTAMVLSPLTHTAMILLTNRIHPTAPNETFIPKRNQIINAFLQTK